MEATKVLIMVVFLPWVFGLISYCIYALIIKVPYLKRGKSELLIHS